MVTKVSRLQEAAKQIDLVRQELLDDLEQVETVEEATEVEWNEEQLEDAQATVADVLIRLSEENDEEAAA